MTARNKKLKKFSLSLIVPFYNEGATVAMFFASTLPIVEEVTRDYEIICINDGSEDNTLEELKKYHRKNVKIKLINFSRNFGKEAALTAGIECASADIVIPIDADLQDPPDLIPKMINKWQEGYNIVLAQRKSRKDKLFKRVTAWAYYKLFAYLTNDKFPPNVGDFRLFDKKVIEVIRLLPEKTRFMKGIFSWVGFKSAIVYYDRPHRIQGTTKLPFLKLLKLAFDGIFSFSTKPLRVWLYIGLFFSTISFLYASFLILKTLILGVDLPGYASIMVTILFIGGLQLVSLGVIGEYIARIYKETKNRPIYIIESKYGFTEKRP